MGSLYQAPTCRITNPRRLFFKVNIGSFSQCRRSTPSPGECGKTFHKSSTLGSPFCVTNTVHQAPGCSRVEAKTLFLAHIAN